MAPPTDEDQTNARLPAPDHSPGARDVLPRRDGQSGRPVQHHQALRGAGDPGHQLRPDPPPSPPAAGSNGRRRGWSARSPVVGRRDGAISGRAQPPRRPVAERSTSSSPTLPRPCGVGDLGRRSTSSSLMDAVGRPAQVRAEGDQVPDQGRARRWNSAGGSARTSPTSSSARAGAWACRPATSAATSTTRASSPPTPGPRSGAATEDRLGRRRPDHPEVRRPTTTSPSPSAATTPTSPPTEASGKAGPRRRSPSPSPSSPSTASRWSGTSGASPRVAPEGCPSPRGWAGCPRGKAGAPTPNQSTQHSGLHHQQGEQQ